MRFAGRVLILAALLALPAAGTRAAPAAHPSFPDLTRGVARAAAGASDHLVRVIRTAQWPSGRTPREPGRIIGTGVALGQGRILTCAGVVGPASEVLVSAAEGDTLPAKVLGVDRRTNVAVLDCPGLSVSPMPLAKDSILFPGDLVVAVGLGPPGGPQASFGTVVLVEGPSLGYSEVEMVQVTAPVFPGFTGGALLDRQGRMVGMISGRLEIDPAHAIVPTGTDLVAGYLQHGRVATTDPSAATLALPVSHAVEIAQELADHGYVERGYLGVQVELTDAARPRDRMLRGVLVHRVVAGGPASGVGIIPGDVILDYAGARVQSPQDLSFLVAATVPGSDVPVRYVRRGRRYEIYVSITRAPDLDWTPDMDATLAGRAVEAGVAPTVR